MYLHNDKENFKEIIEQVADASERTSIVVEKDYYVTLILKLLSERLDNCVFKGGTSLSKGFHAIDRFSEDIDIAFDEHIGESRRKKLKNVVLKGISEELGMPISNWDSIQSDKDYNAYHFSYKSAFGMEDDRLPQFIKLEIVLSSYSFPTETRYVGNYIEDYMIKIGRKDFAEKYMLNSFPMKLQSLERTYIDKVFALCDYYLEGRSKRYSRHLYDLYKLNPLIKFDDDFAKLVKEIKVHRSKMKICPSLSSKEGVDINAILMKLCDDEFYKEDYHTITNYFSNDFVSYDDVIDNIRNLANTSWFNSNEFALSTKNSITELIQSGEKRACAHKRQAKESSILNNRVTDKDYRL